MMGGFKYNGCKGVALIVGGILCLGSFASAADTTVNMQIVAGSISISSPASLTFGSTVTVSDVAQDLEENFSAADQYFYVQDLKGADAGYNTTLQLSGNFTYSTNTISSGAISFKTNSSSISVLSGTTNTGVVIDSSATSYQTLASARSLIKRNTAANTGKLGKYGAQIYLKVTVPAYQSVGTYAGTLVYTIIEN